MFKKIDCVMVRVDDVTSAEKFYSDVFGLKPRWRERGAVGMGMPETDAELVLHSSADIPQLRSRVANSSTRASRRLPCSRKLIV